MEHEEFIGRVRQQAGLASTGEAERACRATLETLGEVMPERLADNVAIQLPREAGEHLRRPVADAGVGELFGRADFITTVADRAGVSESQAAVIAHAVVDALFAATEGGLMAEVTDYLPPDLREYVTPAPSSRDQDESGQVAYGQAAYGQATPERGHG
jgi:uncharacterized protein (DUF2267 family)